MRVKLCIYARPMINDKYYRRRYVITAIAIVVVLTYLIRLFYLQILDESSKGKSENISLVHQTIYPSRGLIYDRNGELLVFNQPIYEITMLMREIKDCEPAFDTLAFCQILSITRDDFDQRVADMKNRKKNRGYSQHTPQIFLSQLSKEDVAPLQEHLWKFPGIDIRNRTLRDYTYPAAAHVLGNVGEVSGRDLERDTYYAAGDYAGRDGLERTYERELRGEKGVTVYMRDVKGRIQGSYHNGEMDRPAVKGADLTTTLDIHLQMMAEDLLSGKIGSVVAIEPKTGEILALASSPTWNPALLVGKERSANYLSLQKDITKPLLNRATQAQYSPGSTFKIVQALVGLQENAIKSYTKYPCKGQASSPIRCTHDHGSPVDLAEAIEQSCNPYFWYAFRDNLEKAGYGDKNANFRERFDIWRNEVKAFGLGQRFTDTDLAEQAAGSIPSTAFYDKYYGKTGWKAITIRSLSIGQGELLVTPLQLANMTAAIANDGYYITPHLNRHDSMQVHRHETGIDKRHFPLVKEGMERVMKNGTGRWYALDSVRIAGKTGTVQNGRDRKDHALFIGLAPVDDPQIAIAVVVENAGFGATWAAPIGSLMIEQYLTDTIRRKHIYDRIKTTITNPDVQTR